MSRPAHRLPVTLVAAVAAALALGACSTGSSEATAPAGVSEIAPAPASPAPAGAPAAAPAPGPAGVSRPAPDQCVVVPEAPDGVYSVFEAGTATVVREGNRLRLVDYQAAEGWIARVDEADGDEVEIDFRRGFDVLDLEVDLDDGVVEVTICADDD